MQTGKEGTISKGFHENTIKFLRALNAPVIFLKKLCINKHKFSHREELARINFTSSKISIKCRISFICPCYWKNSLFSYGRKLLRCSYLFISINGVHWNYGKSLQSINWVASAATGFFPFNQTYTETRPSEIDLTTRN